MIHGTTTAAARGCRCDPCRDAKREYDRKLYAAKAAAIKARKREQYIADPEAVLAPKRARRAADPLAARLEDKRRYAANRDAKAAAQRAKRAADPERARRIRRDWAARTGKGRIYAAERRARELGAFVEHVDPVVVFERDNYVCQGCGIPCPMEAKWPRLNAATHDHIVALANGGEHSYANAQTLCFGCNVSKGNRPNKTPPVCDAGRNDAHRVTTITAS